MSVLYRREYDLVRSQDMSGTVVWTWYWQLGPTVSQLQAPCPAKTSNSWCYSRWDLWAIQKPPCME